MAKKRPSRRENPNQEQRVKSVVPKPLVIGAIAAGILAAVLALKNNESDPINTTDTISSVEAESYLHEYEVDGMRVMSNSVPMNEFIVAYQSAKDYIGGPYWDPGTLHIEYGTAHEEVVQQSGFQQFSLTQVENRSIITDRRSLEHELVHYLIGPNNMPLLLEEAIASGVEGESPDFEYDELDRIIVSMAHPDGMFSESPLTQLRYEALRNVGYRHRNQWRQIFTDLMESGEEISFENLAEFLSRYGIEHEVFNPAEGGHYIEVIRTNREGYEGFLVCRLTKIGGRPEESPWSGPIRVRFRDIQGNEYPAVTTNMQGFRHVHLPQGLSHSAIDTVMVEFPENRYQRTFTE